METVIHKQGVLPIHRFGMMKQGLADLIDDLPSGMVMAEIGCFQGESSLMFLDSGKVKEFYAVDTWRSGVYLKAEKVFDKKVACRSEVTKLKMDIVQAYHLLPKLDFIYIDGNHRYHFVVKDLEMAILLVKKGGIIGGHDYYQDDDVCQVKQAVDEILGVPDNIYKDYSWLKFI